MSVSAPVELKDMRLYFDWGFQVNYNLPYDLSNFYDVAKWPGHSRQHTRAISYDKYNIQNNTHPADATAGEVYMALEELMIGSVSPHRFSTKVNCVIISLIKLSINL